MSDPLVLASVRHCLRAKTSVVLIWIGRVMRFFVPLMNPQQLRKQVLRDGGVAIVKQYSMFVDNNFIVYNRYWG